MLHNLRTRRPALMALLLDLPAPLRVDLARRWGTEANTAALYRVMTDTDALNAVLAQNLAARRLLEALVSGPGTLLELIARVPTSEESARDQMTFLGKLGLALVAPASGRAPRLAIAPGPEEHVYVPPEVAIALKHSEAPRND